MAEIARQGGLAKGTLYLYFPSKEVLFLGLLEERLELAFTNLFAALAAAESCSSGDIIAATIAKQLTADPLLPRLLGILHAVLEKGMTYEAALEFKKRLARVLRGAGEELARIRPEFSPKKAERFFLLLHAELVGLVHLTDISPFMRRIGLEPGLEIFKLGFEETIRDATLVLLTGIANIDTQ